MPLKATEGCDIDFTVSIWNLQLTGRHDVIYFKFLGVRKQMLQLSHLGPAVMILQVVDGQGDHFDPAFSELTTQSCGSAQLCGAHWGVVSGMGEQDSPSGMKSEICKAGCQVWCG